MFESTVYTNNGVNRSAVLNFMKKLKECNVDTHSFEVIQGAKMQVRIAPRPYSFDFKQQLYSLSKSFSSTAIGLLSDDGKVNIDDRIVDIFSDRCPENIGENMGKMRLRHVLSMNTGQKDCVLAKIRFESDPVAAFIGIEPEFEPGTHFTYNNAATYILSQVVAKYTGMTMYDFLNIRLFEPLGITGTHWNAFADGNSQGAVGFHASSDDVAKLGLLYLNNGVYNGKRILSEKWVNTALSVHSDNSGNGTPDWVSGYGFQFWKNSRSGFRGDGAFGQLCMIFPDKDMVVAAEVFCKESMQSEIECVYELADNLYGNSDVTDEDLRSFADNLNAPEKYCGGALPDCEFICNDNTLGITLIRFVEDDESIRLNISDGTCRQDMVFGKGVYKQSNVIIKNFKPTLDELCGHSEKENVHFAAYCSFKGGALHLYIRFLDNPHTAKYVCEFGDGEFTVKKASEDDFCKNIFLHAKKIDM